MKGRETHLPLFADLPDNEASGTDLLEHRNHGFWRSSEVMKPARKRREFTSYSLQPLPSLRRRLLTMSILIRSSRQRNFKALLAFWQSVSRLSISLLMNFVWVTTSPPME